MSFDLDNSTDHAQIRQNIENTFSKSCHILTTTWLIKSTKDAAWIRDWFRNCTDENKLSIFVTEYDEYRYASWLTKSVMDSINDLET